MTFSRTLHRAALTIALTLSPLASAGHGGGVRGGQVYDIDGTPELFSLLDKRNCKSTKSGYQMIEEIPELEETLQAVEKLHWYFGFELRRSIGALDFCFTGPLKWTDGFDDETRREEERQAVQLPDPRAAETVNFAIRVGKKVYIDTDLFYLRPTISATLAQAVRSNPYARSEKIVHEMMHRFFDDDKDPLRRLKMNNMEELVKAIRKREVTTLDGMYSSFRFNDFLFPMQLSELTPARDAIRFLLEDDRQKASRFLSAPNVDQLWKMNIDKVLPYLAPWDQEALAWNRNLGERFDAIYMDLLKTSDLIDFQAIVNKPEKSERNLVALASRLANDEDLEPAKRAILMGGSLTGDALKTAIAELATTEYSVLNSKLFVKGGLTEILLADGYTDEWKPALALGKRSADQFTPKVRALIQILSVIKRNVSSAEFQQVTTENADYLNLFSVERYLADIAQWESQLKNPEDTASIKESISRNLPKLRKAIEKEIR